MQCMMTCRNVIMKFRIDFSFNVKCPSQSGNCLNGRWSDFDDFFRKLLQILFSFHIKKGKVFKNYKFRKKLENINFHPKKRKTGNSAKFRPHSQKRTSDSDSATKNQWKSVKIRIEGIFYLKFVDQCKKCAEIKVVVRSIDHHFSMVFNSRMKN